MVELSISGGNLLLHVQGADRLWAFKSSLEIPLQHIASIRADSGIAHGWWHGWRVPGTQIPGVITAGTFYQDGQRVFWDVHNPDNTVVIESARRTLQPTGCRSCRPERYGCHGTSGLAAPVGPSPHARGQILMRPLCRPSGLAPSGCVPRRQANFGRACCIGPLLVTLVCDERPVLRN